MTGLLLERLELFIQGSRRLAGLPALKAGELLLPGEIDDLFIQLTDLFPLPLELDLRGQDLLVLQTLLYVFGEL